MQPEAPKTHLGAPYTHPKRTPTQPERTRNAPRPSRFKHALLLDCDMQLLRDPAYLFDSPEYRAFGNLFWGDIYSEGMVRDEAYDSVGALLGGLGGADAV